MTTTEEKQNRGFLYYIGFDTVDGDRFFQAKTSFFSFACCIPSFGFFLLFACFALFSHFLAFIFAVSEFIRECKTGSPHLKVGPNCEVSWIFSGPNQVSLGVLVFLTLLVATSFFYRKVAVFEKIPRILIFMWILFSCLLAFSMLSLIDFYVYLTGAGQHSDLQADKVTAMVIMNIYALMGLFEIRFKHFLLYLIILVCHFAVLIVIAAFQKQYVYEPSQSLFASALMSQFLIQVFILALCSIVYTVIHMVKLNRYVDGSLFKLKITMKAADEPTTPTDEGV